MDFLDIADAGKNVTMTVGDFLPRLIFASGQRESFRSVLFLKQCTVQYHLVSGFSPIKLALLTQLLPV